MGIFDKAANKLKNMFIEEIPDDTPTIKKEVIKVPIPAPEEEIEKAEEKAMAAKETKEEKFVFPVYMDEGEDIDPKKEIVKELMEKKEQSEQKDSKFRDFGSDYEKAEVRDFQKRQVELDTVFGGQPLKREVKPQKADTPTIPSAKKSSYKEEIESRIESYTRSYGEKKEVVVPQKKTFIPTPVISPVYGILDENYSKDDITVKDVKKKPRMNTTLESDMLTVDDVRLKAFGTLEDEIDSPLFEEDEMTFDDDLGIELEDNLLNDELEKLSDEEIVVEPAMDKVIRSRRKTKIEVEPEEDNMIEEMLSRSYDNEESDDLDAQFEVEGPVTEDDENLYMSENDLFNLIDSMYEKRDDE